MHSYTRLRPLIVAALIIVMLFAGTVSAFAVSFDDSYCERNFKKEKLWTSEIRPNDFYGHEYDSENGVYKYDWIHQIWDEDHDQLYVQERYDLTVKMKHIIVSDGEFLDSVTYGINVADFTTDTLITYYKSVDDIETPEGFGRMALKVDGYDAVYIYSESKTPGDGNGVMPYATNSGTVYVPILDAPNQDGRINTLVIRAGISGYNFDLYDTMVGEYLGLLQALPCTIDLQCKQQEFKKGAPSAAKMAADDETGKEEKKGISPVVPVVAAVAVAGAGIAVAAGKAGSAKKAKTPVQTSPAPAVRPATPPMTAPKPAEPPKPEKTPEEIKKEEYIEKLRDKYGYEDDKELKKAIMRQQIHNEKMGYIHQADEAWADAALDTAEKSKKVADVTIDVAAEMSGAQGKAAKNIYKGLTEAAEAAGEIMTGRDAAEAITEAVVDTSVGVIENEANGFRQKFIANTVGESGKKFASTYMKTEGDLIKSIDAANDGAQEGAAGALIDGVTDGLVDKGIAKAAAPAKEAVKETLKDGVNASKTFAQDMIKGSLEE